MQSVVLVLTLALCLPAWPTFALELLGYDCTKATSYRKIALTEVAPCPAPSSTPPPASYHGALIQRKDFKTVEIFSCSLRYVQTITRCGMHSHIAAPAQFVATGSHRLSREDCIHVINTGFLTLHGKTISGIKEDVPHPTHIFVKGKSSNTGSCKGDDFEFRGVSYESSTMEREYTIKVGRSSAPCDIASGKVNILNSVACRLTDYSCFDDALGAFYWSPTQKSSCEKDGYSTPYTGPIEVVQRPTSTRDDQRFAVVTGPTHIFAMKLLGNETACGQPMTLTEHPKLSIVFLPASAVSPFPPSGTEIDTMTYVNSKFLYTELRLHDRSVNISAHAMERRCQLQRQQLLQKLQLARDQPELISHIFDQPGIIGRAVGELLYVADCPRTSVTLRRTDRCYDAVPVLNDRNESLFLTPITRIITCTAEPVPCDGPAGPAFNFGDGWVQLTPSPRRLTNPTTLQPDDDRVHFQALDAISTAGLYSREEMEEFGRLLTFPAYRAAVSNTIARAASGDPVDHQLTAYNIFGVDEATRLVKSAFRRMWGWASAVGEVASALFGVYAIFKIIGHALTVIVNGLALRDATGCSLYLVAALWSAATTWVLQRRRPAPPAEDVEAAQPLACPPSAPPAPAETWPTSLTTSPPQDVIKHSITPSSCPVQ